MPLAIDKIKHIVCLMMENRSFDHMFGFLQSPTYKIDGLTGTELNPDSRGTAVQVTRDAAVSGELTPDPGHHFPDVNYQIFGNYQGTPSGPLMQGFVKAYELHTHDLQKSHRIMKCFDPVRIPALVTLAQQYAVCDRWFSSVPGPTLPNRSYMHAATSIGRVDMNPLWRDVTTTIYERLDKFGATGKIYYHDWSVAMTFKAFANKQSKWFGVYDDFERACKKGTLPSYCLIEPRYNDTESGDSVFEASDQHPDHNITEGDTLIRSVYEAIRSSPLWESTLLVITYDEHGGTYDHVIPPATVSPDDKIAKDTSENIKVKPPIPSFDFTRLGVRVPGVIVSPYIEAGTIDHTVYDHTSVIAMALKVFLGAAAPANFLTARDKQANTFERVLTRVTARTDTPEFPEPDTSFGFLDVVGPAPVNNLDKPLSVHQRDLVTQAFQVEQTLPKSRRSGLTTPNLILTERQAAIYLKRVTAELMGTKAKVAGE